MEETSLPFYHPFLLDHNRAPRHYEKRPEAGCVVEAYNALCGDKFKLYLDVADGRVAKATFHGYGCAVSKASVSVLMTKIQGLPLPEVAQLLDEFLGDLGLTTTPNTHAPQLSAVEKAAFAAARAFPGRLKCATLGWEALRNFLF